jgi:KDO2-lipid IV(A) lauroyltransferase
MTLKNIAGKASFHLVKFIVFFIRIFPLKSTYGLCSFIVFVTSGLKWNRKKIALDNIKIVFPEKTDTERKSIFRDSLKNMIKNYVEVVYIMNKNFPAARILQMASVSGLEQLDNIIAGQKGALLYSGHFGNFSLMGIWLALKGYPIAAIYKEAANFPDEFFGDIMRQFNITPLKYKSDAALTKAIIIALKERKIILIQNDQSHPTGIYINFFNKYVPSPAGPALLAKRVGVPIIPAYIIRDKNNHHKITILPEIPLQHEDDHEKFMKKNTQILIDWIAEILIKHPTEWLWLHNRWKRAKKIDA